MAITKCCSDGKPVSDPSPNATMTMSWPAAHSELSQLVRERTAEDHARCLWVDLAWDCVVVGLGDGGARGYGRLFVNVWGVLEGLSCVWFYHPVQMPHNASPFAPCVSCAMF